MVEREEQHNGESVTNSGILAAIQDMARAIRENNIGNHQENAEDRVLKIQGEVHKSKPLGFKGTTDPMIAKEWSRQMKRSLTNKRI